MKRYDYIITGCGLAGLMLAYRMVQDSFFENQSILLVDTEKKRQDDRTWSFWEKGAGDWDALLSKEWTNVRIADKKWDQTISIAPYTYKTLRSSQFYDYIWQILDAKDNVTFLKTKVLNISHRTESASILTEVGEFAAKKVFNSIMFDRRYNQQGKYPVLQQHFVGWFIETKDPVFDDSVVTFMDFSVQQRKKTRFMYILPFAKNKALFEYTLFSEKLLPRFEYDEELKKYLNTLGIQDYTISEVEEGSIPMTAYRFWRQNSKNVIYIGTSGGWTKASTGYTFRTCDKKTKELIEFLKGDAYLSKFRIKSRFWFYDLLFLDVLASKNEIGSVLFTKLFKRNHPKSILQFLDEETQFMQEVKIMLSMPPFRFLKALFKRIRI